MVVLKKKISYLILFKSNPKKIVEDEQERIKPKVDILT